MNVFLFVFCKERLAVVEEQLGKPQLKLIQEVETRWNSIPYATMSF